MQSMDLTERIDLHHGELTEADRRLVKEILASPEEVAFLPAGQLARRAGVHEASAVRLAKKLGYAGYPALRSAVQADLRSRIDPASRIRRRLSEVGGEGLLASLVSDEIHLLGQVLDQVEQPELDRAAQALVSAKTVYLFGHGHATSLVDLADRRLRRLGIHTVRLVGDDRELAELVVAMSAGDVLLAFALRTEPSALPVVLQRAGEVGAVRVLIGDVLGPLVRPSPEVLLAASRGSEDRFQSLLVPMVLLDALVLCTANLDEERALHHLSSISELIERF